MICTRSVMEVHWNRPSCIELRLYRNTIGFGASLIAKLRETSIKKNLYYEEKEQVVEETSDELGRPVRRKQRCKVYGINSTNNVRNMLIDLLRERVQSHKDKIKSKIIFDELSKMVVKRNGKVEHSDNSHDDLTFSYLMALYVWYEGKNLRTWKINKSTIKTEENVDEILGITEEEKKYVDISEELVHEDNKSAISKEVDGYLKQLNAGKGFMYDEFIKQQEQKEESQFREMMSNKVVREAYAKQSQMSLEDLNSIYDFNETKIPDSIFTNFNMSQEELDRMEYNKNFNFKNFNPGR